MKRKEAKNGAGEGFSLVEMLLALVVIAVVTAIAVPAMASMIGEAAAAKNQRNAQTAAALYSNASSAGAVLSTAAPLAAIHQLRQGVTISDPENPLNGNNFTLSIAHAEAQEAAELLAFENGMLVLQ